MSVVNRRKNVPPALAAPAKVGVTVQRSLANKHTLPKAPPEYRPQVPKVLQAGIAKPAVSRGAARQPPTAFAAVGQSQAIMRQKATATTKLPKAPAAYRPNPVPRVLQRKQVVNPTTTRPLPTPQVLNSPVLRTSFQPHRQVSRVLQMAQAGPAPPPAGQDREQAVLDEMTALSEEISEALRNNRHPDLPGIDRDLNRLFETFDDFDDPGGVQDLVEALRARFTAVTIGAGAGAAAAPSPPHSPRGSDRLAAALGRLDERKAELKIKGQQKTLPAPLRARLQAIRDFIAQAKAALLHEDVQTMIRASEMAIEARELMQSCLNLQTRDDVIATEVLWRAGVIQQMSDFSSISDHGMICNEEICSILDRVL